ncbi:hypothetical protein FE257_002813 [Aspergillus nanangensis]|uniref:Gfo/Idh/MocA-like oxidoreductase N-terminal domain-containing protein n=1 Tax=Aspergillus nanangensis TaxID=2582783 RepID=A0AAD4GPW2_ASPNN|nr:hypothetical protein FE257_002813 [Aspergillus nanangensis]
MTQTTLHVGILSAGNQSIQNLYLPVLRTLTASYQIVSFYDFSQQNNTNPAKHDNDSFAIVSTPEAILTDTTIDLVLNFMPNELHEKYTIAALQAGKHVMVENPLSLSLQSAKRITDAEKQAPNDAKVFVACARRHAPCFENVFKKEVASLERIYYARCRNIAGPHTAHTATAPKKDLLATTTTTTTNSANPSQTIAEEGRSLLTNLLREALRGDDLTGGRLALSHFLASLGCHDLGLMRDTFGYPDAISNINVNAPFYSALMHYNGSATRDEHPFTLMYETGTDAVPRCDAHLAVYGNTKTVSMSYGLPYAWDGPMRVVVETTGDKGELRRTESVSTWEETFGAELCALHGFLKEGKEAQTTARDAIQDLKLFQNIYDQYDRQCGTIRTPLG